MRRIWRVVGLLTGPSVHAVCTVRGGIVHKVRIEVHSVHF